MDSAHYHGLDAWSTLSSWIAASKTITPMGASPRGFSLPKVFLICTVKSRFRIPFFYCFIDAKTTQTKRAAETALKLMIPITVNK